MKTVTISRNPVSKRWFLHKALSGPWFGLTEKKAIPRPEILMALTPDWNTSAPQALVVREDVAHALEEADAADRLLHANPTVLPRNDAPQQPGKSPICPFANGGGAWDKPRDIPAHKNTVMTWNAQTGAWVCPVCGFAKEGK